MIKIVKGDLLDVEHGIICHQVNCRGVMGSGVADQIKKKYPKAYEKYKQLCDEHNINEDLRHTLLGCINGVFIKGNTSKDELYVVNMFGQNNYGNDGKQYTKTEKLFECFKAVRKVAEGINLPVHMPYMIGCYRGGADWKEVENLLLIAFEGYEVTLYKKH